jgi:hypothetical protein
MKIVKFSDITTNLGQRFKSGTLRWLQLAYTEALMWLVNQQLFGVYPADGTVLYGCQNTGSGANYIIADGVIIMHGVPTRFVGNTFTAATGAVLVDQTTYLMDPTADPTKMTDGSTRNVHSDNFTTVVDGDGSTPGFLAAYSTLVFLQSEWVIVGAAGAPAFGTGWSAVSTVKFMKETSGFVTIVGITVRGSGAGTTIFTLPSGFRPPQNLQMLVIDLTSLVVLVLTITSAGVVSVAGATNGNNITLGSIQFRVS